LHNELLSKKGVRPFDLTGKPMKGWLLVGPAGTTAKKDFDRWIQTAIASNKKVAAKKKAGIL